MANYHTAERHQRRLVHGGAGERQAAVLSFVEPKLSDDDIAGGLGLDVAEVARVRSRLAAGRDADSGPRLRPHAPQSAWELSPRPPAPPAGERGAQPL